MAEQVDHSSGTAVLAVEIVALILGTIFITLRSYTKFRITQDAGGWSYAWALSAYICGIINGIAIFLSVSFGLGKHRWDLTPDEAVAATKWSWIADAISRPTAALGRAAVVAFIYEIQGPMASRWRKVFLWFMAASNLICGIFIFLLIFFRCTPRAYVWDKRIPGGRCITEFNRDAAYFCNSWGAASDLILAAYPTTFIWILQRSLRVKLGILVLMGLGVFACICAAVRTYNVHTVNATEDTTYVLAPLAIWSITEIWVILVVSSVAPLSPFFRRMPCAKNRRHSSSRKHSFAMSDTMSASHVSSRPKGSLLPDTAVLESELVLPRSHEKCVEIGSETGSVSRSRLELGEVEMGPDDTIPHP